MKLASHSKVLITGLDGFTGQHLSKHLIDAGFSVIGLSSDLTNRDAVLAEVVACAPDFVLHLAAISFSAESNADLIYRVNVQGTLNLLDALCALNKTPKKVILASSATVYGNLPDFVLSESLCPKPVNHYGCSKLAMEHMAQNYATKLPILITRPFNYTGIGHADHFLIPKIVKAYREGKTSLELGNLAVSREFNDVRDVCAIYHDLLVSDSSDGVVNLCSGKTISLMQLIEHMNDIAGYEMNVTVNPAFVRENEIKDLSGDTSRLCQMTKAEFKFTIQDTLRWMYGTKHD
jgi:nucleoside-diphosphate-sugar epimerase